MQVESPHTGRREGTGKEGEGVRAAAQDVDI